MHLSSLYIDGYGPFEDSLISEFTEGLNLFLTEDEPAAAALRDFIWSVIFGFETGHDGIDMLDAPNRRACGGFLGFESSDGPVTVARYRRAGADSRGDASSDAGGLVTVTGPVGSLDQIIGKIEPQKFRRLVQIDAREITAFRKVIRRQIAETFAERAREAAEAESVLREAGGQIDVPTIEEIMDEMRIARDYQVARADDLARSVKGVGRRLRGSRNRVARLKILDRVRPTWNTMLEMQRQMGDLPRLPYLAEDPVGGLKEVAAGRAEAQAQLDAARAAERAKSSELDGLCPFDEEAGRHRDFHELVAAREGHARLLDAVAEAEKEFQGAEASLGSELSEIGAEWSAERVREFAATVDPADIRQHESAIQLAADALSSCEENDLAAIDANAEAAAEVVATQATLQQLGDIPADDESDFAERLGTLRRLKATALAITGKKNVIADLQVKRSDARRLGSGVSRIVMQAQSITSAAFLLVGFIVWGVASIASDGPVQRTGTVMMGAGLTGVIFAAMFLWLQRHPTFGRSILSKNGSPEGAQQPADNSGQGAASVWVWSSWTLLKGAASALISAVRWTIMLARAGVAQARHAQARHAQRARGMKEAESCTRSEAENELSKSREAAEPNSHIEDGKPPKATARGRSPFGIREFLGRFIQIERQAADNANVERHASDEDSPLRAIADEIGAEDDDPETKVDEENASVAMDEAEASIPQELREAQERSEGWEGRIGNLLARVLKSGDETKDRSDEEILSEMGEDGIWSASGQERRPFAKHLVSSLLAVMTRSRSASQPKSRDTEDDDEAEDEASPEAPSGPAEEGSSEIIGKSEAENEPAAENEVREIQEEPESEIGELEEVTAESEIADEPTGESTDESPDESTHAIVEEPATAEEPEEITADAESAVEPETAVEEPPIAEAVAEEAMCEFGDPIEALDEALAAATRELDALAGEFEWLSAQYAESPVPQADDDRLPMTIEMIEHAAQETERQIMVMHEAAEIRSKLAGLEEKLEGTQAAAAEAEEQLRAATAASGDVRDRWVQRLITAGLATNLDPSDVCKISESLNPVRVRISAVEILREKLDGLRARTGELEARVRQVADVPEQDDLAAAFNAIESGGAGSQCSGTKT